jgi:hypothetical protein
MPEEKTYGVCPIEFERLIDAIKHYIYTFHELHKLDHLCIVHKDSRACETSPIAFSRWESADRDLKYAFEDLFQCIKEKCRCED